MDQATQTNQANQVNTSPHGNHGKQAKRIEAPRHPLVILALNSGVAFAEKICQQLAQKQNIPYRLTASEEITFANGETKFVINESVRGADVYVVQLLDDPHSDKSINDNLMALATAINAAYYSDAHSVTAVIPQFPYSRQDKRKGREPITARLVGELIERSGANRAITMDIHSEAIEGFFPRLKLENLHMGRLILEYVKTQAHIPKDNLMVVAPDVSSAKRGGFFAKELKADLAIIDKSRNYAVTSDISAMRLVGDVDGRNVLLCDDMLATGGTLLHACRLLKDKGAQKIFPAIALPFFSQEAHKIFDKAYQDEGLFERIIGSNAVYWGDTLTKNYSWYDEIDATPLFAQVIDHLNRNDSVSQLIS